MADSIDVIWVLLCAGLVFLMQAGFLCLETGLTRTKNTVNVAMKNMADTFLSVVAFWIIGYALMTEPTVGGWFGYGKPRPLGVNNPNNTAEFLLLAAYCGTVTSIVSGAMAERTRFIVYLLITVILSALVFPLAAHWAWYKGIGGHIGGWLYEMDYIDWAGSGVIHMVGGGAALAGIVIVGPRIGRFDAGNPEPSEFANFNLPFTMLGLFLFVIGWIGFNGGSGLAYRADVPSIILNTIIGACGGVVSACGASYYLCRKVKVMPAIIGALAGLVALSASAHAVSSSNALIVGGIAGLIALSSESLMIRLKLDDVVSAVPVHLFGGIWGVIAVGIFAEPEFLRSPDRLSQIGVQCVGAATYLALGFGFMFLVLKACHRMIGLRVDQESEIIGLNISEHGAFSEMSKLLEVMDHQALTHDLRARAPVDSFSEAGRAGKHYNAVVEELERLTNDLEKRVEQRTMELAAVNFDLSMEVRGRIQAERNLEKALHSAEAASRAKTAFLANMSHELRTPLNSILGFSEMIGRGLFGKLDHEKYEEYIDLIHGSGTHLLMLINDILDLSKVEADELTLSEEEIDVSQLIAESINLVAGMASEQAVSIEVHVPDNSPRLRCDVVRTKQILVNLLGNAIKFSNENTTITVGARLEDNEGITLSVSDQGIGMDQSKIEAMFEPFTQNEDGMARNYHGTGLGLSLVRVLAHMHDAKVELHSKIDEGTEAFVFFPPERNA